MISIAISLSCAAKSKVVKLAKITAWLNRELNIAAFDDVSNNGLQIDREGDEISLVAFGVDASVKFLKRAAAAGAGLCVVHHGISWGGGIRRLTGSDYRVVKTAMTHNLALYGVHLPLDASKKYGNNWELARFLKLTKIRPAFNYHGNVIGIVGTAGQNMKTTLGGQSLQLTKGQKIGVCSGGAGDFAGEAKRLGCDLFITGEANWADVIAAENVGAKMVCCGHYETETFGVQALAKAMQTALGVQTEFIEMV